MVAAMDEERALTLSDVDDKMTVDSNGVLAVQLKAGDDFDWETYISPYTGRTRIDRLLYIASHCPQLRQDCSGAALDYIKANTTDTRLYLQALTIRNTTSQVGHPLIAKESRLNEDQKWIDNTSRSNQNELEKLDIELRHYQNNLIKESVRMAHRDLGEHLRTMGNLSEALKYFIKTRDHCSTSEHVVEMCLNVIEVSLELKEYHAISAYVSKAEGLLDSYNPLAAAVSAKANSNSRIGSGLPGNKGGSTSGGDMIGALFRAGGSAGTSAPITLSSAEAQLNATSTTVNREAEAQGKRQIAEIRSKLNVAQGIAYLGLSNYKLAKTMLLEVDVTRSESFSNLASRADVALYIVLCSLAVLDRHELKSNVLDRSNISSLLESDPQSRELIDSFFACEYKKTLAILELMKPRIILDIHLSNHHLPLVDSITRRALRQFVQPFNTLRIERLANSMGWKGEKGKERAVNELIALIQAKEIDGRLDLIDNVYVAKKKSSRRALYDDALEMGQKQTLSSKHLVLRMSLLQSHLIVKAPTGPVEL